MEKKILDWKAYEETARNAAGEGQVLLKNENHVLPIKEGSKIALFGRMQFNYYKSGTGSGGMVNVNKVTGILDALLEADEVTVNQELLSIYEEWEKTHPFDGGVGWGMEPWSQEEMPIEEELVQKIAEDADIAVVIIARTAGEDKDNQDLEGAYRLSKLEEDMLSKVRKAFDKMVVVFNTGNVMDMSLEETICPDAILYAWQGGMVGGYGTVDVLLGRISPSGKLTDTICKRIEDYPSTKGFGDKEKVYYQEDIYVGYRYFETVAKDQVRYPFGFGLSYTNFEIQNTGFSIEEDHVSLYVQVKNIGNVSGKEVVQAYVAAPCGKLGKPALVLAGFQKTKRLAPLKEQQLTIEIPVEAFASYDESGETGFVSSYVLEAGEYLFYTGNSVRDLEVCGSFCLDETKQIEQFSQAFAPKEKFQHLKAVLEDDGSVSLKMVDANLRSITPNERRLAHLPAEIPYTGDQGIRLVDVKENRASMEAFIAQLSDEDLSCIIRGEGMGSPKVTAGTAAAFGGISEPLKKFGIPCGCCDDGPSGMRLDSGAKAFSLPGGTLLACTFNPTLVERLYTFTGLEMVKNKVDNLLGPGMNIHRHPLNGRNFEYFSEDPFVTGKMGAAMLRGLKKNGVTGTVKHFCANNQETGRHSVDCVISERALREIYLKGFEMAVREAGADSVMTTYGCVNGLWTAGNYDLNTKILREEWGFSGIVMTDWWAQINEDGEKPSKTNFAAMACAQNDLYMVCQDAAVNSSGDNTLEALSNGKIHRSELQRNAMNICSFLMNSPTFDRFLGKGEEIEVVGGDFIENEEGGEITYYKVEDEIVINLEHIAGNKDDSFDFALDLQHIGEYQVELTGKSDLSELAQIPATLFYQSVPFAVFSFNGTGGKWVKQVRSVGLHNKYSVLRLVFNQSGLTPKEIKFSFVEPLQERVEDET